MPVAITGVAEEFHMLLQRIFASVMLLVCAGAERRSDHGVTFDTVMRMIRGYENKQHVLFIDNWFTSPAVLDALKQRGIRCCGSVRRNRRGMPAIPEADIRALGRGESIQRQKDDTSLAVWKDQKVVWVLYNHCSPLEVASLERWSDSGNKISIGCPRAIRDYFYGARSVDVLSQLHYAYLPGRKAMRCWPRLAWWLLDMCVVNAFKLWSAAAQHLGQLRFREELMHELVAQLPPDQRPQRASARPNPATALAKDHYPEHTDSRGDCVVCCDRAIGRTRSRFLCAECGVHLCVGKCFSMYHSDV